MAMALGIGKNTKVFLLFFLAKSIYYYYFCSLACDPMLVIHSIGPSRESSPAPPLDTG